MAAATETKKSTNPNLKPFVGRPIVWMASPGSPQKAALITGLGTGDRISLTVFDSSVLASMADGVPHVCEFLEGNVRDEDSDIGCWDYNDGDLERNSGHSQKS
jgi:hypothetical protein